MIATPAGLAIGLQTIAERTQQQRRSSSSIASLTVKGLRPPPGRRTRPIRLGRRAVPQFDKPAPDCAARHAGNLRDDRNPAPACRQRFRLKRTRIAIRLFPDRP